MRKIATIAAVFTVLGSGATLAQGAAPGYCAWQSSWPGYAAAHPDRQASAPQAATTRPDGRGMTARNSGSVPVAGNTQGARRGG